MVSCYSSNAAKGSVPANGQFAREAINPPFSGDAGLLLLSRLGPPAGKNNQYGLGVRTSETFPSNNHWLNSLLKLGTSVSLSKREPAYKASPSHFNLNMRYRHEENWGQLQTRATLISKLTPTQMLVWGLCLILSNHGKDPLLGLEN